MRKLCLYDSLNQDERQQVTTFIANMAVFQQRLSAMPKAPLKLQGKYIEFDETSHCPLFKKLSKCDDQLSSKNTSMSSWTTSWTTSQRLENVFYRNIRQRVSSGHLVTVEANHHWLPNQLLLPQHQEVTYTM